MQLRDKVVLVTGGARRVGAVIVSELARAGARVCLHYRSSRLEAERLVASLRREGASVLPFQANLEEPAEIEALFGAIDAEHGGLDVLVGNAAFFFRSPLEDTQMADWQRCLQVNLTAPFWCARLAAARMKARGNGVIIHIADVAGERGWPNYAAYSCSQAGLLMLTEVLAVELAPSIRVNAVAPGVVLWQNHVDEDTRRRLQDKIPLQRIGTPEAVADAVRFLIEQKFVTGEVLRIDGGRNLRP